MVLDGKLDSGQVIVLDGAVGSEIARRGGRMDDAAWCALANRSDPDIVRGVHEAYIAAGADVITTNTFATCHAQPHRGRLAELNRHWGGPVMAYPEATAVHPLTPAELERQACRWVDQGVQILGGCCGTTPEHVRALARRLKGLRVRDRPPDDAP